MGSENYKEPNEKGMSVMPMRYINIMITLLICACPLVSTGSHPSWAAASPPEHAGEERDLKSHRDKTYSWGEPVEGVRIGAKISAREIGPTSPLWVQIIVENRSDQSVTMFRTRAAQDYTMHMSGPATDATDETAYLRNLKKSSLHGYGPRIMVTLEKGETFVQWIDVRRLYDLTQNGEYHFQISRDFMYKKNSANETATILTPKLTVVVDETFSSPPEQLPQDSNENR